MSGQSYVVVDWLIEQHKLIDQTADVADSRAVARSREACSRIAMLMDRSMLMLTALMAPDAPGSGLIDAANALAAAVDSINSPLDAPRPATSPVFRLADADAHPPASLSPGEHFTRLVIADAQPNTGEATA